METSTAMFSSTKRPFGRAFCSSSGVRLAERLSRFHKEALTFEVFLAKL